MSWDELDELEEVSLRAKIRSYGGEWEGGVKVIRRKEEELNGPRGRGGGWSRQRVAEDCTVSIRADLLLN